MGPLAGLEGVPACQAPMVVELAVGMAAATVAVAMVAMEEG